jgi:RND family efflux transporter MFP subunit
MIRQLVGLAALIALAGCGREAPPTRVADVRPVRAEQVRATAVAGAMRYAGDVRARHESELAFRVGGRIVARQVEVGSAVRAGQVIATLDAADYALAVAATESQLAAARADAGLAEADLKRYTQLRAQNFISEAELDRRRALAESAAARVRQLAAELARQGNQRAYTRLVAPWDGVVTAIRAEPGQVVAAGQAVAQVARSGEVDAAVSVPENALDALRGARALGIRLWSVPGKVYRGRLRELAPAADPVTRTYAARIAFVAPDADVKLGMTAEVTLDGAQDAVLTLPQTALFSIDGAPEVWVVDPATHRVAARALRVGELAGDRVVIVSGLSAGEWVVTAGAHKLVAGQTVRLVPDAAATP